MLHVLHVLHVKNGIKRSGPVSQRTMSSDVPGGLAELKLFMTQKKKEWLPTFTPNRSECGDINISTSTHIASFEKLALRPAA